MNCECCDENPIDQDAVAHGYNYCEECKYSVDCSECFKGRADSHLIWESGRCESCQRTADLAEWKREVFARLSAAATANGWTVNGIGLESLTVGSDYINFDRGDESFEVRISDHEICSPVMRSEPDYSIEYEVSGTSHGIETVVARLSQASR